MDEILKKYDDAYENSRKKLRAKKVWNTVKMITCIAGASAGAGLTTIAIKNNNTKLAAAESAATVMMDGVLQTPSMKEKKSMVE